MKAHALDVGCVQPPRAHDTTGNGCLRFTNRSAGAEAAIVETSAPDVTGDAAKRKSGLVDVDSDPHTQFLMPSEGKRRKLESGTGEDTVVRKKFSLRSAERTGAPMSRNAASTSSQVIGLS